MKLNRILLLVTLSLFISIGAFASNQDVKVVIDGIPLKTDIPAQIVNGHTLVPMRAIFDKYGIKTEWYDGPKIVSAYRFDEDNSILLDMKLGIDSNIASINGKLKYLDQAPMVISGRTMVPLRFISEVLGSEVVWDQKTKTVNIFKKTIKIAKEKDYEIAFTNFLYGDELQDVLNEAYKTSYFTITNDLEFAFYDIDRDGVPELLLTLFTGFSDQIAIYEFKNGKINSLYSDLEKTEEMGATMIYYQFHHDTIKNELYSLVNQKYTNWMHRYNKQYGFKEVYEHEIGGSGEILYKEPGFNTKNIKPLKMQPFYNIDYNNEGYYETE